MLFSTVDDRTDMRALHFGKRPKYEAERKAHLLVWLGSLASGLQFRHQKPRLKGLSSSNILPCFSGVSSSARAPAKWLKNGKSLGFFPSDQRGKISSRAPRLRKLLWPFYVSIDRRRWLTQNFRVNLPCAPRSAWVSLVLFIGC